MKPKYSKPSIIRSLNVYVALIPCFAFIAIFLLYPCVEGVLKSFYFWKIGDYNNPQFIGLKNYSRVLADPLFWKSFSVLGIMVLWSIVLTCGIVMPITHAVYNVGEGRMGRFLQRAFVLPMTIPTMVFLLFWRFVYEPNNGLLNNLIRNFGFSDFSYVWLGDERTALLALIFMNFPWISACGLSFLIFLAGFQNIDKSLHEAADIDGAKLWTKFTRIDIPLIIPQIRILLVLSLIGGIQQYTNQLVMTQGGPNYATTVPGLLVYFTAFRYGDLGRSSTIGVIMFSIIMAVTLTTNKLFTSKA